MEIKITRGLTTITTDSVEVAAQMVREFEAQDAAREKASRRTWRKANEAFGGPPNLADGIEEMFDNPWTPTLFQSFVDTLAISSRQLLAELVKQGEMQDTALRDAMGVVNNQALAGILSAISKRAAAHGIPSNRVFHITNHRSGGRRSSLYSAAADFAEMSKQMNWVEVVESDHN